MIDCAPLLTLHLRHCSLLRLWPALTVRENLRFAAALYLPSDISAEEREARVSSVIDDMGLTSCADTRYEQQIVPHRLSSLAFLSFSNFSNERSVLAMFLSKAFLEAKSVAPPSPTRYGRDNPKQALSTRRSATPAYHLSFIAFFSPRSWSATLLVSSLTSPPGEDT